MGSKRNLAIAGVVVTLLVGALIAFCVRSAKRTSEERPESSAAALQPDRSQEESRITRETSSTPGHPSTPSISESNEQLDDSTKSWQMRSCKLCDSIQKIEIAPSSVRIPSLPPKTIGGWRWHYKGKTSLHCQHDWQRGFSSALPDKVADRQVVIVRKGDLYGAFVLVGQSMDPETTSYRWCYGTDKEGVFNTKDAAVKCASSLAQLDRRAQAIKFGPFEVSWSGDSKALGYIYYAKMPGDELKENDLAICVTDRSTFEGIRPGDQEWRYRRHRFDGE